MSHHKEVKEKLPAFINDKRDLSHFWSYIKNKFGLYEERRVFIRNEFVSVLDYLEKVEISPPFIEDMEEELEYFNSSVIMNTWRKLLKRKETDPEGSLTLSNSLVESSLKHILDELEVSYSRKASLHQLYSKVAKELRIAPEMYEEEVFKQILGSCSGVISGLSFLRSELCAITASWIKIKELKIIC